MFHQLDTTLQHILDDPAAPTELRAAEVSFLTPDRDFKPDQATVNLFLHEVRENTALRDTLPIVELKDGVYERRSPPLRVDCTYLVSAWSEKSKAEKIVEEHRLLGMAFAWLSRFPTIPKEHLQGALAGQPYPPPTMVAQMDGDRRSGEFWSALGIAPRPTFSLVVTIALDLQTVPIEAGPPVTAIEGLYGAPGEPEALRQVGGRVFDDKGRPLAGALVELPEAGFQARTDDGGHYLLPRPADGSSTLRVSAAGFIAVERTLIFPPRPEEYKPATYEFTLKRQL